MINTNQLELQKDVLGEKYSLAKMIYDSSSFEELFIKVSEIKIDSDWYELSNLEKILDFPLFAIKFGGKAIVYLKDSIATEKLLPCKSKSLRTFTEKEMQNYIVNNFNKIFPDMEYIGKEVIISGIGRIDILAKKNNRYVIMELKCENKNPNIQLIAYSSYYENPILIGITENELNENFKLDNITYYTYKDISDLLNKTNTEV